jgi:predicted acyltransferase
MSTITSVAPHHHRIVTLDILRGLNVALMIFINELAKVKGLPWWTYHAPGKIDAMTYVTWSSPASFSFSAWLSLSRFKRASRRATTFPQFSDTSHYAPSL